MHRSAATGGGPPLGAGCRRQSFLGLTADGGYAEYIGTGASAFVRVPSGFTAVEAASVMCTFGTGAGRAMRAGRRRSGAYRFWGGRTHPVRAAVTVWHAAIARGRLQPGERLLVTGASGGVGSAAVLLAKAMV